MSEIRSPRDVVYLLKNLTRKRQEHFGIILLDGVKNVISKKVLFIGSDNFTHVYPRIIFWYACQKKANSMIIFHNHPSGNTEPSIDDVKVTKTIESACELIGIQLLDHVIIGKYDYFSFAEHEMIGDKGKEKQVAEGRLM